MANLYGTEINRKELLKRIGDISQVAGVKEYVLSSGKARGVRALDFKTGSGLTFTVLPGRAMDIAFADFNGMAIGYISKTGIVAPSYYEEPKRGFFRSFFAGLLTTCGLGYMGAPNNDNGEELGLHGRISNTDAEDVCVSNEWNEDEFIMTARGKMREAKFFGEYFLLDRTIKAKLGENKIYIHDKIENSSFVEQPLMLLYHFNFGYPLVSEDARMVTSPGLVVARNEHSKKGLSSCKTFEKPTNGYVEELYEYDLEADKDGFVYMGIVNYKINLGVYLKINKSQIPRVGEWKQMGEGEFVVGIEPVLGSVEGRSKARTQGNLCDIKPLEVKHIDLELTVLSCEQEIKEYEKKVKQLSL